MPHARPMTIYVVRCKIIVPSGQRWWMHSECFDTAPDALVAQCRWVMGRSAIAAKMQSKRIADIVAVSGVPVDARITPEFKKLLKEGEPHA